MKPLADYSKSKPETLGGARAHYKRQIYKFNLRDEQYPDVHRRNCIYGNVTTTTTTLLWKIVRKRYPLYILLKGNFNQTLFILHCGLQHPAQKCTELRATAHREKISFERKWMFEILKNMTEINKIRRTRWTAKRNAALVYALRVQG